VKPPVVIGAGQSGISAALSLKDLGIEPVVLEQGDHVGASWRGRYDRLRLNTSRFTSKLPGRPFAKGTPLFPSREQVWQNLEQHAGEAGLDIRFGVQVQEIRPAGDGWEVVTSTGSLQSPQVVVATGHEREPFIPDWEGREAFTGKLMHAAEYRNPEPFQGSDVLVVGPGCSGMEIAYDLATSGAGTVRVAVRTSPNVLLRAGPGGVPGDLMAIPMMRLPNGIGDRVARMASKADVGDLTEFGLPAPEMGVMTRQKKYGLAPAIVDKEVVEAIKARAFEVVAGVSALDGNGVLLLDGTRLEPDAVICATGYRRGLEPLVGSLGVLDDRGLPKARGADPAAPGLRFIGYVPRPGQLGYSAKEGKRAAREIARELAGATAG
jgi:cation diffusion facilitator CzcD-associated flavoprotein CzcO